MVVGGPGAEVKNATVIYAVSIMQKKKQYKKCTFTTRVCFSSVLGPGDRLSPIIIIIYYYLVCLIIIGL